MPVSMLSRRRCLGLAIACWLAASTAVAEPDGAEQEFQELKQRFEAENERYFAALAAAANSPEEQARIVDEIWPGNTLADSFLEFEAKHRPSHVGFSALYHLVSMGASHGDPAAKVSEARAQALEILQVHYLDHPDLDVALAWLSSGARQPVAKTLLRRATVDARPHVRGVAALELAELLRAEAIAVPQFDAAIALKGDDEIARAYAAARTNFGDVDVEASRRDALALLEQVANQHGDDLEAPRAAYGPLLLNIQRGPIDALTGQKRRTLAERAEAMRFELENLAIGQRAPEIAGPDAKGNERKLSDERGKAVVLMYSFKGCGPCEAMYPDNRKLVEQYRDQPFAFLGVMGDSEIATVHESIDAGIITWPVWWDGSRGPIAKRWNVNSWPTIYVLDCEGVIRYRGLRGELLARAVAKLVDEAENAATSNRAPSP